MSHTTLTRTDVLDVCAVMLQRCRLTAGELAAHMGEPPRGVVVAAVAAPAPDAAGAPHMTPRLLEVLDKCDCADGMSAKDLLGVLGIAMQTAFEYLSDLHRMGRVTRVKLPGRPGARYFARPAHALAWADGHAAALVAADVAAAAVVAAGLADKAALLAAKRARAVARAAPKPVPAPKPAAAKIAKGGQAVGAFVQAIARPTGDVIIPPHVVIPRAAPAPDTRFTVAPGQVLTGGFSTSRPGINPVTGKAWGAAA
ncbi:hypothetical protein [Acidovorax sp.]|uniref:hypothetical protein n=1 Tax=Acidovorax sp. TaxID=1872122 RepID=UPI002583AB94|nr:hypothetical protein [Acidovorax sp.]